MPVQQSFRGAVPEFNQTSAEKRCGPAGCWQNRKVGEALRRLLKPAYPDVEVIEAAPRTQ
jgi:hypothetical protein